MVDPKFHWAVQLDITYRCGGKCANCHRLVPHQTEPHDMSLEQIGQAFDVFVPFCQKSPPSPTHWRGIKCIGLFGGEPLLHPRFKEILALCERKVPQEYRGLWTSIDPAKHPVARRAQQVIEPKGYLQVNRHDKLCVHQPVLAACSELITDPEIRRRLIWNCALQKHWCSSVTHKGYFFCEIAGAIDILFRGPGGKPVEPGCWERPISDFVDQMAFACHRCGMCIPLPPRQDQNQIDDITPNNLRELAVLDSPRVLGGGFRVVKPAEYDFDRYRQGWDPLQYFRFEGSTRPEDYEYKLDSGEAPPAWFVA